MVRLTYLQISDVATGGMGGPGPPPTYIQTTLEISAKPLVREIFDCRCARPSTDRRETLNSWSIDVIVILMMTYDIGGGDDDGV